MVITNNLSTTNYFFCAKKCRYNTERLCNKLGRVERYIDWREPIKEGYFPKLNSEVASQGWPSRVVNMKLQNLNREADQIRADVDDLVQWKDRITAAIHSGYVLNASHFITLHYKHHLLKVRLCL